MNKSSFFIALGLVLLILGGNSLFAQQFSVQYRCAQTEAVIGKIKPQLILVNKSGQAAPLSAFKMRYYFSAEGYVKSILSIDYAVVGSSNITGTFTADYLEIGFTAGAGTLAANGTSGDIQLRIEKESHGYYIQSNDYSFAPELTSWTDFNKVTCYYNGELVWGVLPPPPPAPTPPPPANDDWLHADGATLKDKSGHAVRLTGINWFGFETNPQGLGGLQAINWQDTLKLLATKGFNVIRLPMSLAIVRGWMGGVDPKVQFVSGILNPDIDGVSSLTLLDKLIDYCKGIGLKIIFDMHTLVTTDIQKKLWYNSTYSLNDFQTAWQWLATRYNNDDTVIGMDLINEPHGQYWVDQNSGAKWDGSTDSNNWRKAAGDTGAKILAINPNLLIIVEGIESTPVEGKTYGSTDKYDYICSWWGGNLREVKNYPVQLGTLQSQLVYSPHDYGPDIYVQPWFASTFDINTLYRDAWQPNWYYIVEQNIAPVFIGEWGGKLGGNNQLWLEALSSFINQKSLNHTFWAFNPDSSDTGGIVDSNYAWDTAKYNIVEKSLWQDQGGKYIGLDHQVTLSGTTAGTNVALYYGTYTGTPTPTSTPTPTPTRTPTATPTITPTAGLPGDVNSSGKVDINDALLIAQKSAGLNPVNFNASVADVTRDGTVNILDAMRVAQYAAGIIPQL